MKKRPFGEFILSNPLLYGKDMGGWRTTCSALQGGSVVYLHLVLPDDMVKQIFGIVHGKIPDQRPFRKIVKKHWRQDAKEGRALKHDYESHN